MEFHGKKSHFSLPTDEEANSIQSLNHRNSIKIHEEMSKQDLHFSPPCSPSTTNSNLFTRIPPPSPESPWTLSPHQTPSPSLLYMCVASLHRQHGSVHSISISKGTVFTGSDSKHIHAWRQQDCIQRGYIKTSCGQIRTVLAHGNALFTSHKDCKIRIWNFTYSSDTWRAKKVATMPKKLYFLKLTKQQHKDLISCIAYDSSDELLYTGSYDRTVKVWRISDRRCVDSFTAHEGNINSIVINQDDGCVFTCSSDASVKLWRRVYKENTHTLIMTLKFQQSPVNALTLSFSTSLGNCFLYSGCSDGIINFWEKEKMSGRFNHGGLLQGHRLSVLCLVAVGKLVFSGSEDTTIRVWRREEGSCLHECLAVLNGHRGPVKCLAACLETEKMVVKGYLVYSGSLDQSLKVWRVKVLPVQEMEEIKGSDYWRSCGEAEMRKEMMELEYEMGPPVLSPSWVEKKINSRDYFH